MSSVKSLGMVCLVHRCFTPSGIQDDDLSARSLLWKVLERAATSLLQILLSYLPLRKDDWIDVLERSRRLYKEFVIDLWEKPRQKVHEAHVTKANEVDHVPPVSLQPADIHSR